MTGATSTCGCDPTHLDALLSKLKEVGVKTRSTAIRSVMGDNPFSAADIITEEFPGFPTDMQAQLWRWPRKRRRSSSPKYFREPLYARAGLVRMGANIKIEGRRAVVRAKLAQRRRRPRLRLRPPHRWCCRIGRRWRTIIDRV